MGAVLTLLPPVPSSGWEVALGPIPALGRDNTRILAELGFDDGFDGCTPNRIPRRGTMIQEDNR